MMDCDGCGEPIPDGEDGRVWCTASLGMTALVVHKTQACGQAALEKHGKAKMLPGNRPPLSKAEKAKARLQEGAA